MIKTDRITIIVLMLVSLIYFLVFTESCNANAESTEEGGETIYVPKDFKTIKEALENAKKGDKIYIDGGKYEELDGLSLRKGIEMYGSATPLTKVTLGSVGMNLFGDNKIHNISFNIKSGQFSLYCADNVSIKNCIISGSGTGDYGLYIEKSENVEIVNCIIANFQCGILFRYPPSRVLIRNSIIAYNKQGGVYISTEKEISAIDRFGKPMTGPKQGGGEIKVELEYNDVWGSVRNYYGTSPGEHDISKDPKFVDMNKGDYHLQPGSPCIDAGDPDSKYNDPDGSRNDLGALPYGVKKEEE